MGSFQADAQGNFQVEVTIPNRQIKEEPQAIRATGRVPIGAPTFSREAKVTWDKIIETVFMALLATTFGTLLSIPISFFAARNLMSDIKIPLSSISLSLIGWPLGMWLGIKANQLLANLLSPLFNSFLPTLAGTIVLPILGFLFVRWMLSNQDEDAEPQLKDRLTNLLYSLIAAILVIASILFLGRLLLQIGEYLTPNEEVPLYFIRKFIFQVGDIIIMLVPAIAALVGGGIFGGLFGNFGQTISDKIAPATGKVINLIITPIAGAAIAVLILQGVDWFYQFNNPAITLYWPAGDRRRHRSGVSHFGFAKTISADWNCFLRYHPHHSEWHPLDRSSCYGYCFRGLGWTWPICWCVGSWFAYCRISCQAFL